MINVKLDLFPDIAITPCRHWGMKIRVLHMSSIAVTTPQLSIHTTLLYAARNQNGLTFIAFYCKKTHKILREF